MNTKSLHFDKMIESWDDAVALGNGDLGCLIWNKSDSLRFSIDKGGIWDCSNPPENQEESTYENLKRLVREGNQKEITRKYDDCYANMTPTKLPTGKLIIDLGIGANVVSDLDFMTAEGTITAGDIKLKSFVHATENYGIIEINKTGVKIKIENPQYGDENEESSQEAFDGTLQALKNLRYPKASFVIEKEDDIEYQYFIQPTFDCFYDIV